MAKAKANRNNRDRQAYRIPRSEDSIKIDWVVAGMAAFGRVADKFGTSFAVLVLVLLAVRLLGKDNTWDDFVREVLFGQVTHRPWLGIIVAILVMDAAIGGWTVRRWLSSDSKEMRRIADEKSKLQELLMGRKLHHTEGGPSVRLTESHGSPILTQASDKEAVNEEEPS